MASKHPSDEILKKFPVSEKRLTVDDAQAVQTALGTDKIISIGRALQISRERTDHIERLHRQSSTRQAIAIIDTWLRGDYNDKKGPYIAAGNTKYPSWRSLVWAVVHNVGGNNRAKAITIAKEHKKYHDKGPEPKFKNVTTKEFEDGEAEDIASELEKVWGRWYEIGFCLKVPTSKLDVIEGRDISIQDKMMEMIREWIQTFALADEPPCWRQLVEAVAASYGGQNRAFAGTLASNHGGESSESMEVEEESTSTPQRGAEREQQGGVEAMDSTVQAVPPAPASEAELDYLIADDGGKQCQIDDFIVYRYNMSSQASHGLALIISNEKFDPDSRLSQRICAPYDQKRLERHLSDLGYRTVVRKNQTGAEIHKIFEDIGKNTDPELHVKKEDDSFVCIISSHGEWDTSKNTDVICGRDRGPVDLQQLVYSTLGATSCELLKGKPKLFFIQACRGEEAGTVAADSGPKSVPAKLPRESDFLFSYSTAPMTKAYRYDPNAIQPESKIIEVSKQENYDKWNIGSFYITELCMAFNRFSAKMDLVSMLLFVHHQLQATEKNAFKIGSKTTRQCPHLTLSLRGPVFFNDTAFTLYEEHVKKSLTESFCSVL